MKNKLLHSFLFIIVIFAAFALAPKTFALSGSGTEEDPYIITSADDLSKLHDHLDAYFALGGDIDLKGVDFYPVGNELEGAFSGTLDGKGQTISNLSIDLPDNKYVGLFGYIEGTVTNVKLSNVRIAGGRYVGGIAGNAGVGSSITYCDVISGSVDSHSSQLSDQAGGITGLCEGYVSYCINGADISSYTYAGGIIGYNDSKDLELKNCLNTGHIYVMTNNNSVRIVGGIVGYSNVPVTISECENLGILNSEQIYSSCAGGIVGRVEADISINDCINSYKSNVYAGVAGGMVGYFNGNAIVIHCANAGSLFSLTRYGSVGGMIGYGGVGECISCTNSGKVSCSDGYYGSAGGMVGNAERVSIINCVNLGDIHEGGWVGNADASETRNGKKVTNLINCGRAGGGAAVINITAYKENYPDKLLISHVGVGLSDVYCSDINTRYFYNISDRTGFSLHELRNPESDAYAAFDPAEWVFDHDKNSGLPMPAGYDVDYMNESFLILKPGETTSVFPPFEAAIWETYDPEVAVVSNGTITARKTGSTCITAWNEEHTRRSNCIVYVYEPLQSVSITSSTTSVAYNGTLTLSTDVPADDPQGMIWSSSDENVATVSQTGEVRGNNPGKTIITLYLPLSDISASCEITVTGSNISNLYLYDRTVNVGDAVSVINVIYGSARHAVWASCNEEIAVVDKEGKVTGVKAGTAMITASWGSSSATCTVTVKQPADSIALNTNELTLEKGLTAYLSVELQPEDCTDTITWTSNNSNIAAVSDGLVTAKGIGKAAITAKTSSGKSASCLVTVVEPAVMPQSVKLSQSLIRPQIGEKIQLYATVLPDESTNKNVKWESSNQEVAIVSDSGVVEAIASGTTVITASSVNGYYDSCQVVVKTVSSAEFVIGKSRGSVGELFDTTVYLIKNPGISAFTSNRKMITRYV